MSIQEVLSVTVLAAGGLFFLAGTVGVIRFPDSRTRLHAVAKADSVGLGLVVLGLVLIAPAVVVALKLVLIWLLAMTSSAVASYLIGGHATADEADG